MIKYKYFIVFFQCFKTVIVMTQLKYYVSHVRCELI